MIWRCQSVNENVKSDDCSTRVRDTDDNSRFSNFENANNLARARRINYFELPAKSKLDKKIWVAVFTFYFVFFQISNKFDERDKKDVRSGSVKLSSDSIRLNTSMLNQSWNVRVRISLKQAASMRLLVVASASMLANTGDC